MGTVYRRREVLEEELTDSIHDQIFHTQCWQKNCTTVCCMSLVKGKFLYPFFLFFKPDVTKTHTMFITEEEKLRAPLMTKRNYNLGNISTLA